MPTKYSLVIADTSCFILLAKIDQLDVLRRLFSEVYTTPEIANEFGQQLPDWILVDTSTDHKYQQLLAQEVDLGEASAIALSLEKKDALLILDDRRARKLAKKTEVSFYRYVGYNRSGGP